MAMEEEYDFPSQLASDAFLSSEAVQMHEPERETNFARLGRHIHSANMECNNGLPVVKEYLGGKLHGKIINDPVHGTYRLSAESKVIFDTRQFQRLRRLKQLGMTYYVFPGASHNRFEHSLGVAHLAQKFAQQLWSFQRAELPDVDRSDIQVVELAGLCHDLGHGPFSHVFEREFLRQKGVEGWDHEDMSAKVLDHLVDENHIDVISEDDLRRVKQYITSGHGSGAEQARHSGHKMDADRRPTAGGSSSSKRWLSEVVANGHNSIDVDKFDYLARDALYCGVNLSVNFSRLMQFSKVIDDEICYKYTEYSNIYELLHARYGYILWEFAIGLVCFGAQPPGSHSLSLSFSSSLSHTRARILLLRLLLQGSHASSRLHPQEGQGNRVHGC